jgi:hypothetical protein
MLKFRAVLPSVMAEVVTHKREAQEIATGTRHHTTSFCARFCWKLDFTCVLLETCYRLANAREVCKELTHRLSTREGELTLKACAQSLASDGPPIRKPRRQFADADLFSYLLNGSKASVAQVHHSQAHKEFEVIYAIVGARLAIF